MTDFDNKITLPALRERATCPKCGKENSELYKPDLSDFRLLKCSECKESSKYVDYWLEYLQKRQTVNEQH